MAKKTFTIYKTTFKDKSNSYDRLYSKNRHFKNYVGTMPLGEENFLNISLKAANCNEADLEDLRKTLLYNFFFEDEPASLSCDKDDMHGKVEAYWSKEKQPFKEKIKDIYMNKQSLFLVMDQFVKLLACLLWGLKHMKIMYFECVIWNNMNSFAFTVIGTIFIATVTVLLGIVIFRRIRRDGLKLV